MTLVDSFVQNGLSISFLVGLIVSGLSAAVIILWRDLKAQQEKHKAELKELQGQLDAMGVRLDSAQEKRVQESKERSTQMMELTEQNVKALTETAAAVEALKDALLVRSKSR